MMSPPATIVHKAAGSNAGAVPTVAGSAAFSFQAPATFTRSTPNNVWLPQASARTEGPTSSARRNASRSE